VRLFLSLLLFVHMAVAMPASSFDALVAQVDDASFSSEKIDTIRSAAQTNTFSAAQAARLIGEISMSGDQMDALGVLAPKIEDPGNAAPILAVFSFSSDKEEAAALLAKARPAAPAGGAARAAAPARGGAPTLPAACGADPKLPALEVRFSSTWSAAQMDGLIASLEGVSFSSERVRVLGSALARRPEGFSAPQVTRILKTFGFNKDMVAAVQAMDAHLLGMTAADVKGVLAQLDFAKDRLAVLGVLRDTITDAEHKFVILDAFDMSGDKAKARAILDGIRPRSFLFGTVNSQSAVFVMDVSGSMQASFRTNQGRTLTRLDFVRCELAKVLTSQLGPQARFNLVLFADGVQVWQSGLQPASPGNVGNALAFLQGARAMGKTNVHGGLEAGFQGGPDAVYLLTDGTPTAGAVRDAAGIADAAKQWSGGRTPVHGIAFLTGSHGGDDKPASKAMMREVAAATGGVYRAVE
jgi:hypothetical protein